jgi:hypothetical protein
VAGDIVDNYCYIFDRGVVHIVVAGDIVDNYCLRFDRDVVHIVVAAYNNQAQQYEPLLCQT